MEREYTPSIVSMDGLTEAVAASVYLSLEEQQQASLSAIAPIGPTMGYIPPYPTNPIEP